MVYLFGRTRVDIQVKMTVLRDRYQVLRVIGKGAHGIVYHGVDSKRKRPLALKSISLKDAKRDNLKRILRELRALRLLKHENVVLLVDVVLTEEPKAVYLCFLNEWRQTFPQSCRPSKCSLTITVE